MSNKSPVPYWTLRLPNNKDCHIRKYMEGKLVHIIPMRDGKTAKDRKAGKTHKGNSEKKFGDPDVLLLANVKV